MRYWSSAHLAGAASVPTVDPTSARRPWWRVVVGLLLVLGGAGLFVAIQVAREDGGGAGLDGLLCGLVVALGVVALQRPGR